MKISFVVAASENGVIGVDNQLPWHLPDDLRHFKKNTIGHPIIMGRKTFFSFGRALPGRRNIILSKTLKEAPEGTEVFNSMEEVIKELKELKTESAAIIGGGIIFKTYRSLADEIILTRVHTVIQQGSAFFDLPDNDPDWKRIEVEEHPKDDRHALNFTFEKWVRVHS